jgi:hypothetical protein
MFYTINPVVGATGYVWAVSANGGGPGALGTISAGQGTVQALVSWPLNARNSQRVTVYATNACGNSPVATLNVNVGNCLRLESNTLEANALVYPNPARDRATLRFEAPESGDVLVNVLDLNGRRVWSTQSAAMNGTNEIQLSFGQAPAAGMYFVELRMGELVERVKVMVE